MFDYPRVDVVTVEIHKLPHAPEQLPAYATAGSAGLDLQAALDKPLVLAPMERALIPTGLVLQLPEGYEAQIRPRSGLSIKHGVTLINCVGTIDSDYRQEVKIPMVNLSNEPYEISPGERVAQLVIAPISKVQWQEVSDIQSVEGRSGGFGSTGKTTVSV